MRGKCRILFAAVLATGAMGCTEAPSDPWRWNLPAGFPAPKVPVDNPMSASKVELGRHLFYDPVISEHGTQSCASCHDPALAFTDAKPRAVGPSGEEYRRGAMGLINVAYATSLTWANPHLRSLREQALMPMFGEDPLGLGMAGNEEGLMDRLATRDDYAEQFADAFPESGEPLSVENVLKAIASFERSLVSADSPYDRYIAGDEDAMSSSAKSGMALFFSEAMECYHCHGGLNLSSSIDHSGAISTEPIFQNNGLYNVDGIGAYPMGDTGLQAVTGKNSDMGKFKPPSLRNVAVTAPYMHDGTIETLDGVLDHYARGGRLVEDGPYAGDGRDNPHKSALVSGFELSDQQRADLLAFLHALTDESALSRPEWGNPHCEGQASSDACLEQ